MFVLSVTLLGTALVLLARGEATVTPPNSSEVDGLGGFSYRPLRQGVFLQRGHGGEDEITDESDGGRVRFFAPLRGRLFDDSPPLFARFGLKMLESSVERGQSLVRNDRVMQSNATRQYIQRVKDQMATSSHLPSVDEVPNNVYLEQSAWAAPHRTGYAQGSSPLRGVTPMLKLTHDTLENLLVASDPIFLFFTADKRYLWGSSFTSVFKVDRSKDALRVVDYISRPLNKVLSDPFHGAYSLLSSQGVFFAIFENRIEAYYDTPKYSGERITKHTNSVILDRQVDGEIMRALCMAYDGHLIFATNKGRVGAVHSNIDGDFDRGVVDVVMMGSLLNATQKADGLDVSNSIACDEYGGVYVVSDKAMHKLHWDGRRLETIWETPYVSAEGPAVDSVRLGKGSGSSPTLMGDRKSGIYVVITDGAPLMNVVILDAHNGRIIAHKPVTFGDPNAKKTLSEQSILVHGWRLVIVNNTPMESLAALSSRMAAMAQGSPLHTVANALPVLMGDAPRGVEQMEFNSRTGKLRSTWVNRHISIPNGIPTMSAYEELIYGIGKRSLANADMLRPMFGFSESNGTDEYNGSFLPDGTFDAGDISAAFGYGNVPVDTTKQNPLITPPAVPTPSSKDAKKAEAVDFGGVLLGEDAAAMRGVWTLEAIDWWTGDSVMHYNLGAQSKFNSLYAATQVGPEREIYTGTLGGIIRVMPLRK